MSGFFGLGNSQSKSEQTTNNTDARVVGGDTSTNLSVNGNGGPVNITTTDAGAVANSLRLALAGVHEANTTAQQAISSSSDAFAGALRGQQQFTSAVEQIKTGDKTTGIVVAGFAVIAVAAVMVFKKKGG
ncbi:LPXTG cell wall anchor domain-containing protein [Roseateles sp.]|uniref:LPXTG cell wall anchor domain-containing protein n=1 Tax=Roseateles sp. TaxID=1971397 RepID=UPI002E0490C8|nr:LPXTG cell wall anchor domain-containing protein [Roseateles sp.]HEV6968845.1 LPXTG cell wall anchor domain-containing protein [Roseateles sp.]